MDTTARREARTTSRAADTAHHLAPPITHLVRVTALLVRATALLAEAAVVGLTVAAVAAIPAAEVTPAADTDARRKLIANPRPRVFGAVAHPEKILRVGPTNSVLR